MRKNKLIAKMTALTLAVTLGTFSFFSGTTKTALADIAETTTQAVTEMQTEVEESETVNTDNDVETVNEKQNDNQEKATESKPDSTEDSRDAIEDETEETIKEVNPTKYSSATVTIHRVSNGKAASNASFEIFGVKDTGEGYETLEQFKGMKFYSHGIKKTDGNGNLTFTDLSLDEDEWYFIKDLSNNNVINVGSLPLYFNSEPTDGRIEENNGRYILYDVNFKVTDKKAEITNLPVDEPDTIMPLLMPVPEAKVQASGSYDWEYRLYSSTTARSTVKISKRKDFYHGSGSNKTQASIFKLDSVYAACAQHNKSTTLTNTYVKESKYTGSNAGKLRKLLYYGYGGYDNGATFIKAYGSKPSQAELAFATIISTSKYYSGNSCWDSWNVMATLQKVVDDNTDPEKKATAATSISFKNSSGKNVSSVKAHLASDDSNYNDSNYYYYSDWITISSNGSKSISMSNVSGVTAYRKRSGNTSGATALGNLSLQKGDKLKFRFNKNTVTSGKKATVKMTSAGGISELYVIVGKVESSKQDVMREYIATVGDKSDSLTFTMPTDTTRIPTPPKYAALSLQATATHEIIVKKYDDKKERPLANAKISVTNELGEKKTAVTGSNGEAKVSFTYNYYSSTYSYFEDTGDLSAEEIQNAVDSRIYRTREDAENEARVQLNRMINEKKKYVLVEVSAPDNFQIVNNEKEIYMYGANAKEEVEFFDASESIETGSAKYETYYYQELDIGKVNSEDTSLILPGVQFQAYPTDIGNGSSLIEVLYEDENGDMHTIKDESGIDTTLTESLDGYLPQSDNETEFYKKFARKGNAVVSTKTNSNGVIRIGYVYKLMAVGNYSYVKNYNNLTAVQKKRADELINNQGYYTDETSALAAAKKEVTEQLENVRNKYEAWENPIGINNPYDEK
ncbi:hypothetical protein [Eubacterium ventriosum]|uniref:hypothetical protein n=1 Tax=Eubacterium ventriosum TaxID=39496 RepID=UPI0035228947